MKNIEKVEPIIPCEKCGSYSTVDNICCYCILKEEWDKQYKKSLKKSKNKLVAEDLCQKIKVCSSNPQKGGWTTDLEYYAYMNEEQLHSLAEIAGGWFCWHKGVVFVPMNNWLPLFEAFMKKEQAFKEHMKAEAAYSKIRKRYPK